MALGGRAARAAAALSRRVRSGGIGVGRQLGGGAARLLRPGFYGALWRRVRPVATPLFYLGVLVNLGWIATAVFVAYVWPLVFSPLVDSDAFAGFERAADRARGVALVDGEGRRFGVMSGEFDRDHLGDLPGSLFFAGLEVHPDHKTLAVEDAPPAFWRCLAWLEDRGRGGWDNPFGVSFTGVLRIPYGMGSRLLSGRDPMGAAGGSTLEMQLARSMWKRYRHNSSALVRKVREWRAAPVLNRALVRGPESEGGRRFRTWAASHIPLVRGVGGAQGSLYGVETAAWFLFGKPAARLTVAEQLVLAAAAQRPIRMRRDPDARRAALARLAGSVERPGRAMRCTGPEARLKGAPVIENPTLRAAARAELDRLSSAPFAGPFIDPDLAPLLAPLIDAPSGPRLEPQAVARRLAQALQAELAAELTDIHLGAWRPLSDGDPADQSRHPWRGRVSELRTSVDVAASARLREAALAALAKNTAEIRAGPTPRLAPDALGLDRSSLGGAPLLILAMDLDGRIVRYAQTGFDSVALGTAATRPDWGAFGDGPRDPSLDTLSLGSLGKVGAALLLAEAGRTDLGRAISNACLPGLSFRCMNPRSGTGGVPSATPERLFAASLNAAAIRAVARADISDTRIDALLASLGLRTPPADETTPGPTRLALGRMTGRPLEALRLMAAALAYAEADFDRPIPAPRFISGFDRFDPRREVALGSEQTGAPPPTPLSEIARPGPEPLRSARFVRRVLEAPLCFRDNDARPTLNRLRDWCAASRPELTVHLAKSGTVGVGGPRTPIGGGAGVAYDEAAWWVAGAVRLRDGRAFVYVALAGDGSATRPFARGLGAGRLAPAVSALLADLTGAAPAQAAAAEAGPAEVTAR
ncbi:MAG: transglycosylase domain-containing protein [Pseudomonadota bacterium]